MRRILSVVTALLLAGLTLWDVYALASDPVRPAQWWHLGLGLTDVSLLGTVAGLVWRKSRGAHHVVLGDLFFVLGGAFVLVRCGGVTRFAHGFDADEYLSLFLVTLTIRVGLYVALAPREAKSTKDAAEPR